MGKYKETKQKAEELLGNISLEIATEEKQISKQLYKIIIWI